MGAFSSVCCVCRTRASQPASHVTQSVGQSVSQAVEAAAAAAGSSGSKKENESGGEGEEKRGPIQSVRKRSTQDTKNKN
jgi:hypothetical protein